MPTGYTFFNQQNFDGSSGASITTFVPSVSSGVSSPYYGIDTGSWAANGSGAMVGAASSTLHSNQPLPASSNATILSTYSGLSVSASVGQAFNFSGSSNAIVVQWSVAAGSAGSVAITDVVGGSGHQIGDFGSLSLGGNHVLGMILTYDGSTYHVSLTLDGTAIGSAAASAQTTAPTTASAIDYEGGSALTALSLVNAVPVTATISGPSTGIEGSASSNFTVTLNDPSPVGGQSVAEASTVGGDTFTPSPLVLTAGSLTGTFTATASTSGARTITPSSSGITFSPTTLTLTASSGSATAFTLTGPSTGIEGVASANFTFTPIGTYSGVITPSMTGLAGTWSPTTLTWSAASNAQPATFTPSAVGSGNANGTGSPSLTPPSSVAFAAAAPQITLSASTTSLGIGSTVVATVTPDALATGTATVTPSGSASIGLIPVVLNFTASATPQTASYTPTVIGDLILTLTVTTGQTVEGSPITVVVTSLATYQSGVQGPNGPGSGWATGLVGTLGVQPYANSVIFGSRITAGIVELPAGSGEYQSSSLQVPSGTIPSFLWDNGSGTYAPMDLYPVAVPLTIAQIAATPLTLTSAYASAAMLVGTVAAGSTGSAVIVSGLPAGRTYVGQHLHHYLSGESRTIASQAYTSPNYTFNFTGTGGTEAGPFSAVATADPVSTTP